MTGAFAGLTPCVHCGFCLQSCPTLLVTGDEADGPRGRIVLMQALDRGALAPDDPGLTLHLDRCLGCRACEPVCPSGVVYGPALEEARRRIAERRPVSPLARLVLAVMAEDGVRRVVLGMARAVRPLARWFAGAGRIGFAAGMLDGTKPADRRTGGPTRAPGATDTALAQEPRSAGPSVRRSAVFLGCIQRDLFSHVNRDAEYALRINGYAVTGVPGQGCCGALHAHAGLHEEAVALARRNVRAFAAAPDAAIAVTAAGCGAMLKSYGALLADDPLRDAAEAVARRVRDVTELLAEAGPRPGGPLPLRVAYDPPCHLLHAQRVDEAPRQVLRAIPALQLVAHEEAELCCGSAGVYGLLQPAMSRAVLDRKVTALCAAGPDVIATGNPGCAMQLRAGLLAAGRTTPVVHPVELLARSYDTASRALHSAS